MNLVQKIFVCLLLFTSIKGSYGTRNPSQTRSVLRLEDRKWLTGLPKELLDGFLGCLQYFGQKYIRELQDDKDPSFKINQTFGYFKKVNEKPEVVFESIDKVIIYKVTSTTYYQIHDEHCLKIDLVPYDKQETKPETWYFHMSKVKLKEENRQWRIDPITYQLLNKETIIRSILEMIVAYPEYYEAYSIGLLPNKGNICYKYKYYLMDMSDNRIYDLSGKAQPLNMILAEKGESRFDIFKRINTLFKSKKKDKPESLSPDKFKEPEFQKELTKRINSIPILDPKLELAKIYDQNGTELKEINDEEGKCSFKLKQNDGEYEVTVATSDFMNYVMKMYIEGLKNNPIRPIKLNKIGDGNNLLKYELVSELVMEKTGKDEKPAGLKLYLRKE